MTIETTTCHIIKGNRILLKRATRGISKGKWNAPGGKIDKGETPEGSVIREVFEETGLRIRRPFFHGELNFYLKGRARPYVHMYLFSARRSSGKARSTVEGRVKWFDIREIPYDRMWQDDRVWVQLMMEGMRFDADFNFDEKNEKLVSCSIRFRKPG